MSARMDTASELDRLARMLPPWCAHLRHPDQFWPQFDALSGAILARADPADTAYVMERIADMLAANGMAGVRRRPAPAPRLPSAPGRCGS